MPALSPELLAALQAGEAPLIYARITDALGTRLYARAMPAPQHVQTGVITYNGLTRVGDGSAFGAGNVVIDLGPYLSNVSAARETLTPSGGDLFSGLTGAELPSLTLTLLNVNGHFSDTLGAESWLTAALTLLVGVASLPISAFVAQFQGVIVAETLSAETLQLEATT